MKKLGAIGALAALLAAIAVISPLTSATGAQGAETLKYTAVNRDGQLTDVDADGSGDSSAGDYFVGNFVLRRGGKARGHLEFHCFLATVSPDRTVCHGVAHIAGRGELALADVANADSNVQKVTITGGNGDFGGASGNGRFEFGKNRAHLTFTVR